MGYTKIKAVKNHLARCLDYTSNPVKTERFSEEDLSRLLDYTQNWDKTEHQLYVTGFNCDPANACDTMNATRKRWGKDGEGHVLAYHLIQSFKPGEITPQQAHEIGCEFTRRLLADRYEVTVSTHLDKSHLHNHIVFNSVAFVDGKMFRNQFRDYYRDIRQISDDLCRENQLKVIAPKGHGKNYAEWAAEKAWRPTVRGTIKADVDCALERAVNWSTFVLTLNQMGYEVAYGRNIKYAKLRPKGSPRAIRFKSLGPGYSEQELRERLEQPKIDTSSRRGQREQAVPLIYKKVRFRGSYRKHDHKKITGFMALYYHYLYLFGKVQKRRTSSRKTHFLLWEDFRTFERYKQQAQFLWQNRIQTTDDLHQKRQEVTAKMEGLVARRQSLYKLRSNTANGLNKADLSQQIQALTEELRGLRKELRYCDTIEQDAEHLRQQVEAIRLAELEAEQQKTQHKNRRERDHHEYRR